MSEYNPKQAFPRRRRSKIGNGFVGDPDSDKRSIVLKIPHKFLKRIDHYCDVMMIPRTEFFKAAYLNYMKEKGIYDYKPLPEDDFYVGPNPKEIAQRRELDLSSWTTDGRDFGESDSNPNELSDYTDTGEILGP
jgi:hypothetical protein